MSDPHQPHDHENHGTPAGSPDDAVPPVDFPGSDQPPPGRPDGDADPNEDPSDPAPAEANPLRH